MINVPVQCFFMYAVLSDDKHACSVFPDLYCCTETVNMHVQCFLMYVVFPLVT
jgi:hypothetical protein